MEINGIHINQYINGELQGETLAVFEAKLNADKDFRNKVDTHKEINTLLMKNYLDLDEDARLKEKERLQPIFDEMREKYFTNKKPDTDIPKEESKLNPTIIKRLIPFVALAAAAALLIFLSQTLLQTPSNPEIAEDNFNPYPLGINQMGGEDMKVLPKDVEINYNNGKFEEANKQLDAFLKEKPGAPEVWLAKGCSAFKLANIDAALSSFEKAIENDDGGIFHPDAHWYLALCYLKKDNAEKAIHHLKEIKEGADNYTAAKRIIDQLE